MRVHIQRERLTIMARQRNRIVQNIILLQVGYESIQIAVEQMRTKHIVSHRLVHVICSTLEVDIPSGIHLLLVATAEKLLQLVIGIKLQLHFIALRQQSVYVRHWIVEQALCKLSLLRECIGSKH